MKILSGFFPIAFAGALFVAGKTDVLPSQTVTAPVEVNMDSVEIRYTGRVKAIIDAKCYDCHSAKGEEKAREELMWDELPRLGKMDQVYALDAIVETLEKDEMPPRDYLKKHPEDKLTAEEVRILVDWANALADKILD